MEGVRVISARAGGAVGSVKLQRSCVVLSNKRVIETAAKAINVSHHTGRPVEDAKKITKEFLSPATDLVDRSSVLQNLFDCTAIAQPEEFGTPKKFPVLTDGPSPATSFAHKRVVMGFTFGAAAGTKSDGAEASAMHSEIECTNTFGSDEVKSSDGRLRVVWLHENPTHTSASPISFQKARLR